MASPLNTGLQWAGLKIWQQDSELTRTPKLKLPFGVCSEEMTTSFNNWLEYTFGYDYQMYKVGDDLLVVHPDVIDTINSLLN